MSIQERIADELDISLDKVEFIVDELWRTVRYYISNPLESKKGILMNRLGKFEISRKRLHFNMNKDTSKARSKKEFYEQLLKQLTNG